MNRIVALNICLLADEKTNKILQKNYEREISQYTSEGFEYIPHVSLAMLFIQEDKIKELSANIEKFFTNDISMKNNIGLRESTLYSLELERNQAVNNLQKDILNSIQKYKCAGTKDCFITSGISFTDNVSWVDFFETGNNYSGNLHITLGKNEPKQLDLSLLGENILFPKLALGQMGNFCAVRKIYHTINMCDPEI